VLPNSSDLKAKISLENPTHEQRLESLKKTLKLAYKYVTKANKSSHLHNKRLYDRKARLRNFEVGELVYLYKPTIKPGLSRKFSKCWTGPYKITAKISDLNYEIIDQKNRKQVVHVNRIKIAYNTEAWNSQEERKPSRNPPKNLAKPPLTNERKRRSK